MKQCYGISVARFTFITVPEPGRTALIVPHYYKGSLITYNMPKMKVSGQYSTKGVSENQMEKWTRQMVGGA